MLSNSRAFSFAAMIGKGVISNLQKIPVQEQPVFTASRQRTLALLGQPGGGHQQVIDGSSETCD
jgi:hypothetical protein